MNVLLVNGSPHEHGCTYTALAEIQKTLEDIDDAITHVESIINSIRLQQEVK